MIDAHTFRLDGQLALITGSSAGIGLGLARGLAQAGAAIVLNGRHADKLQQAATQLRNEGFTIHERCFDVTDEGAYDPDLHDPRVHDMHIVSSSCECLSCLFLASQVANSL